jgi:hypothetical protein
VVLAAAVVAPNLWWQATNGWPQLTPFCRHRGRRVRNLGIPMAFLPYQFVLVSPLLVPVWLCGLVQLLRSSSLVRFRSFGWAYVVLAVTFLVAGGKPYYLAGMFPVLLAAGAPAVLGWLHRWGRTTRWVALTAALGLSLVINCLLMLPLVPAEDLAATPIVDINYDAGETVGWPEFAGVVAGVLKSLPVTARAGAVVLTGSYGEAGAIDRYGSALGLPPAPSPTTRSGTGGRRSAVGPTTSRKLLLPWGSPGICWPGTSAPSRRPRRSTTVLDWTTRSRAGRVALPGPDCAVAADLAVVPAPGLTPVVTAET